MDAEAKDVVVVVSSGRELLQRYNFNCPICSGPHSFIDQVQEYAKAMNDASCKRH